MHHAMHARFQQLKTDLSIGSASVTRNKWRKERNSGTERVHSRPFAAAASCVSSRWSVAEAYGAFSFQADDIDHREAAATHEVILHTSGISSRKAGTCLLDSLSGDFFVLFTACPRPRSRAGASSCHRIVTVSMMSSFVITKVGKILATGLFKRHAG